MDKQHQIITINRELPSKISSYRLLDEIYERVKPSVKQEIVIDKPFILYGAGNLGRMAKLYFDNLNIQFHLNIQFLFVIDKESKIRIKESFWNNIEIIKPEDVPLYLRKNAIFIICNVTSSYYDTTSSLKKKGFLNLIPFYDVILAYKDNHLLQNGWMTGLLNNDDYKGMEYVLSNLGDNISCAHYLQFIAWHSIREEWIFKDAPIVTKEKYFIPEIVNILNDYETFVNIGAYDGEFTNKFIKNVSNKFNSIYAFEPDRKNINKFLDNTKENMNIHLIPKALGKITEKKKFYTNLKCLSQLSELGQEEIEVHKLDDFKLSPTIVKIHTEGSESDIFDGGIETIKKNRPIMMMTIYHNRKGLWEIPFHMMKSLTNYVYYFRLHLWYGTCAIIYAIPKERLK